ncbi:MAG: hypothetical protein M3Y86_03220 [Verrucomicrobiota bacterium]|nr:hypothetical protein [Verrucomicrobiota bacterium]
MKLLRAILFLFCLALASCSTTQRASFANEQPPRAVELAEERSVATMHFAPGIYLLDAADRTGWFYRAPEGVIEHGFGAFARHEGGIFLARAGGGVRGYVVWAGGRTKLGNLAGARLQFRE